MDKSGAECPVSLLPYYHSTGPLTTSSIQQETAHFFRGHFGRDSRGLTVSGRAGISAIMHGLCLKRSDEVCVLTTFDYPNVSSCVTSTIFNYCKPSRVMTPATRAVFVIHEFGVPYGDMEALAGECRRRDIPLIEDCAHTIDSANDGRRVGTLGDWVVCSLPKIFPVLTGGVLLGATLGHQATAYDCERFPAIDRDVRPYLSGLSASSTRRREVYRDLTDCAAQLGLEPVFVVRDEITPWLFPLPMPDVERTMDAAAQTGVECGRWHGTNIVVFPCHQYLGTGQIRRIGAVIEYALGIRK